MPFLGLRKDASEDGSAVAPNPPPADDEEGTELRGVETTCLPDLNVVGNAGVTNRAAEDQASEVILTKPSSPESIVTNGNLNETPDVADSTTKQSKSNRFTGVSFIKRDKCYRSQISIDGKLQALGNYQIGADAAMAYDECCKFFSRINGKSQRVNFGSHQDYIEARSQELREAGNDIKEAGSVDKVYEKIRHRIDAILSSKLTSTQAVRTKECMNVDKASEAMLTKPSSPEIVTGDNLKDSHVPDVADSTTKQPKSSRFTGVSYNKRTKNYQSYITIDNKNYTLGRYHVQADAAMAYDECRKVVLRNRGYSLETVLQRLNFRSHQDYVEARSQEIREAGDDIKEADSVDKVYERIRHRVDAVLSSKLTSTALAPIDNTTASLTRPIAKGPNVNSTVNNNAQKNTSSGQTNRYRGVSYHNAKYQARIRDHGKDFYIGTYELQADAAHAYDRGAKELHISRNPNFKTAEEYQQAREQELIHRPISVNKVCIDKQISERIGVLQQKNVAVQTVAAASKHIQTEKKPQDHSREEPEAIITKDTTDDNLKLGSKPELQSIEHGYEATSASTIATGHTKKMQKRQHKLKRRGDRKLKTTLELNEMTETLTKKWGALLDQNSSLANCMETHQRDITAILTNMNRFVNHEDLMVIESDSSLHSDHPNAADEVASHSSHVSIDASAMSPTVIERANITLSSPIDTEVEKENGFEESTDNDECAQSTTCCVASLGGKQDAGEDPQAIVKNSIEQVATSNGCAQSVTSEKDGSIDALFDDEDSIENMVKEKDVDPQTNIDNPTEDIGHDATNTVNINPSELMTLNPDQMETLPFPIGCPVWSNLTTVTDGGATFQSGTVICAAFNFMTRQLYYKVVLNDGNVVWLDELAFGPTCPIYYSPTDMAGNECGEMMMCYKKSNELCYTALISSSSEPGKSKVIEDIPGSQIKYRKEPQVKSPTLL